jgi:DNA-binding MarR family transcriptional regulator
MATHLAERSDTTMAAPADVTLLYLIKQVELAVRSRLDDVVGDYGLTSLQYTAMTILERHPGMTSAELARNSFVRAQTMAQMTTYLEARGLVRRERDPQSKRQYLLFLTDEGSRIVHELRDPVAEIERMMTSGLTQGESAQLRASLRAARVALGGGHPH